MYTPLLHVWAFLVDIGVYLAIDDPMNFVKLSSHHFGPRDINLVEIGQVLTPVGCKGSLS